MGDPNTGEIYEGAIRNAGDVPLTHSQAESLRELPTADRITELQKLKDQFVQASAQPDLRTREGAKSFLDYHAPDDNAKINHANVNKNFQVLLDNIWDGIPNGPGKTVAIRSLNHARMDFNSAIANHGQ
jgi:hypothetical protein